MKKIAFALILLLVLASCTAPTGVPDPSIVPPPSFAPPAPASGAEPTQISWCILKRLVPPDRDRILRDLDGILRVVNEDLRFQNTELNIEFAPSGTLGDQMVETVRAMIASGERHDIISLYTGNQNVYALMNPEYARDISGEIEAYPALMGALDPAQHAILNRSDGMYALPTGLNRYQSLVSSYLILNRAVADGLMIDGLTSAGDIIEACRQARNAVLPYQVLIDWYFGCLEPWRRTYDAFPCVVTDDLLFAYYADGTVEPYITSRVLQEDMTLMDGLREVSPDAVDLATIDKVVFDATKHLVARPQTYDPQGDSADIVAIRTAPEQPQILGQSAYGHAVSIIPANAPSAAGLRIFDWIYSEQKHYDLLAYGIEGINYTIQSDETIQRTSNHAFDVVYAIEQYGFTRETGSSASAELKQTVLSDPSIEPMPWDGFIFDYKALEETYYDVYSLIAGSGEHGSIKSVLGGFSSLEDLETLAGEVDAAGMPALLDACRAQYSAYREKRRVD